MVKILFVCLGNICRSPMAEFIFKELVHQKGMENHFILDSAATSHFEIGKEMDKRAQRVLKENHIPYGVHRARMLSKEDYQKYDYIIGMDTENLEDIYRIVGKDTDKKIYRLWDFSGISHDVEDPWYTQDFEQAFQDLFLGCQVLLQAILKKKGKEKSDL